VLRFTLKHNALRFYLILLNAFLFNTLRASLYFETQRIAFLFNTLPASLLLFSMLYIWPHNRAHLNVFRVIFLQITLTTFLN
jgi:hypothetical protein